MDIVYGIYIESSELNRNLRKKINCDNYKEAFSTINSIYETFMSLAEEKKPCLLSQYLIEDDCSVFENPDFDDEPEPIQGIVIGFLVEESFSGLELNIDEMNQKITENERLFLEFFKEKYNLKRNIHYYFGE